MKAKQYYGCLNLKDRWDNVIYNMIDYPSIETVLQNFNRNFIQELPFLDEYFILNILNNIQ